MVNWDKTDETLDCDVHVLLIGNCKHIWLAFQKQVKDWLTDWLTEGMEIAISGYGGVYVSNVLLSKLASADRFNSRKPQRTNHAV